MDSLIDARSLTKMYGIVLGVNDVTVSLPPGLHGLLGPNGAGKSTFLKLITGQLRPTEGTIRVFSERPFGNPDLFHRIGYAPEVDAFWPMLTGLEFVTCLARMSGMSASIAERKAKEALDRVGAIPFMDRKIGAYSKGMRQRTKVAQALVHDPKFLILDEPLSGMDPLARKELIDLIRQLGSEGRSILVASHVMHEVQSMTDAFLMISNGRILATGRVDEIRGLLNEIPHRIEIRGEGLKDLAHRLVRDVSIQGMEISEEATSLSILTHDPKTFYDSLPGQIEESNASIREITSEDDNLDAVFDHLMGVR